MATEKTQLKSPSRANQIARWVLIVLDLVAIIAFAGSPQLGTGVVALCGCVLLALHSTQRYGAKNVIVFVVVAYVISTIMEETSVLTGFPFGNYHYNAALTFDTDSSLTFGNAVPWIDQVPIVVGVMYIAVCYFSWSTACIILDHADERLGESTFDTVALPLVAAFIMCQFDLVQDPVTSTYGLIWIWEDGGGVFGVPLVNFLGWLLTAYLIMQVFALYLRHTQKAGTCPEHGKLDLAYWVQPVAMYLLIALSYVCQYVYQLMNNACATIVDEAGMTWSVTGLHECAVTIMVFTMLYTVILACIRLYKEFGKKPQIGDGPVDNPPAEK